MLSYRHPFLHRPDHKIHIPAIVSDMLAKTVPGAWTIGQTRIVKSLVDDYHSAGRDRQHKEALQVMFRGFGWHRLDIDDPGIIIILTRIRDGHFITELAKQDDSLSMPPPASPVPDQIFCPDWKLQRHHGYILRVPVKHETLVLTQEQARNAYTHQLLTSSDKYSVITPEELETAGLREPETVSAVLWDQSRPGEPVGWWEEPVDDK